MTGPAIVGIIGAVLTIGSLAFAGFAPVPANTWQGLQDLLGGYVVKQARLQKLATLGAALQLIALMWQQFRT